MAKKYKCERCGKEVLIRSKGLCQYCRSKELPPKEKKRITSSYKKKVVNPDLSGFFRLMLEKLEDSRISYTGKPIHFPTVCNVCHILPKRFYKSVATEEQNIIFLSDSEHTRFDHLLDCLEFDKLEQEFPGVWKIALDRIKTMMKENKIKECGKLMLEIQDKYFKTAYKD